MTTPICDADTGRVDCIEHPDEPAVIEVHVPIAATGLYRWVPLCAACVAAGVVEPTRELAR